MCYGTISDILVIKTENDTVILFFNILWLLLVLAVVCFIIVHICFWRTIVFPFGHYYIVQLLKSKRTRLEIFVFIIDINCYC